MTTIRRINDVDRKVMQAVDRHWREYNLPPTIRWVSEQAGVASLSHVASIFTKLAATSSLLLVNGKPVPLWVSQALKEATHADN